MPVKNRPSQDASSKRTRRRRPLWWRITKIFLILGVIALCIAALWFGYYFSRELAWAEKQMPRLDELSAELIGEPTQVLSADGKVIFRAQAEYRKPVRFEEIPKTVINATLAAEDERFYQHRGIDYIGAMRAVLTNLSERRLGQGGSTITMQLAKRMFTSDDKSFSRKVKDMALAYQIENTKTKDEILKLYLNEVFYGAGAYGISAAASVYFGKRLDELTIAEAALLARLVQRPTAYNPFVNPDLALEKRDVVLRVMEKNGLISNEELEQSLKEPLRLRPRQFASGARIFTAEYFANYVLDTIRRRYPDLDITRGGYRVETTIDLRMQRIAEEAVRDVVRQNRRRGVTTGAFVLMDKEGKILSMVGGVDYDRNQYNVITQGRRQPGSAMKPFIYAAALSSGAMSRYDSISNEPFYINTPDGRKRWPKGGGKGGSVSMRTALAGSINVPAVRVIEKVTPRRAAQYCESVFGFTSPLDPVLALVLGSSSVSPLELAQAYSVFMLYGDRAKPFGIVRIVGPDGKVYDDFGPEIQRNLLDPQVSEAMDDMLRAVVTSGTGRRAGIIPNARGKTGTTSDNRDAWFCGYTNNLVGIAWVASEKFVNGRPVYEEMADSVMGGQVSVLIWNQAMKGALRFYDDSGTNTKGRQKPLPNVDSSEPAIPVEEEPAGEPVSPENEEPTPPDPGQGDPASAPETNPTVPAQTPPVKEPPPNRNTENPPPGGEQTSVEVCVESGGRANAYCPETVTRNFPKGREPGPCRRHGSPKR